MKWRAAVMPSLVFLFAGVQSATACPYCDSETGRQVRAGIFDDQFWNNVTLTLLPLFVLLGIVALIYFDLSWLRTWMNGGKESSAPHLTKKTSR